MAIRDLPDMYALRPQAYISGKSPMAMLQPLHVQWCPKEIMWTLGNAKQCILLKFESALYYSALVMKLFNSSSKFLSQNYYGKAKG